MIETHSTIRPSAHYARLGQQEREKIHRATLEVLERIGVDVHDERARAILVKGGVGAGFPAVVPPPTGVGMFQADRPPIRNLHGQAILLLFDQDDSPVHR